MAVLVTGGAGGVGLAVARNLLETGGSPIIADLGEERVRTAAREIGLDESQAIELDVADEQACVAAVANVADRHGRIEGVVCCAAVLVYEDILSLGGASLLRTMEVNVNGSLYVCQAAARSMIDAGAGGSIVLFSTAAAHRANGSPGYSASKAAVEVLMREMAIAWAEHGIRVNAISPGPIETEMSRIAREDPEITAALMAHVPLRRFAQPEEMATVAAFLLGAGASFITGAVVPADGGFLAL
jgi:NAD(P)-dependent dehydrogenase (short-subunit alcohol dehydrogenase family)